MHRAYCSVKRPLFSQLPKQIVELGPGAGANFRYYPRGTEVTAIEPNRFMLAKLELRAAKYHLHLRPISGRGGTLGLPDNSTDVVVASLVLCTVGSPKAVLGEIKRILRPGGRYLFVEHVAAGSASTAHVQRFLRRPWRWFFQGCDLMRETDRDITDAGFARVEVNRFQLRPAVIPFAPHIYGRAEK